jgi:glucose/arabinose dehydrogenase/mono/diheme cytochrome c family protein
MKRLFWIFLGILVAGLVAWRVLRGPDPALILASIEAPPAPVLTPEEELATFRVAPGFRVEPVATEPLVVDPVAMDWDDAGRLYVVEMRGFMPDIDGRGEERPVGRVVMLEDLDGDGRMDRSRTFLDELVLPRAIAVLPEGVLIGVPPDLLLCENIDDRCVTPKRLGRYAATSGNVEHSENRLLPGLDGWIYNAKSSRRFRVDGAGLAVEETAFRGQWGIDQDDDGRLYYNHNSGFLYVDLFPAEYAQRQPATAARILRPGINVNLAEDAEVFGVRVAPGLNRAYEPGALRRDGRQKAPTAVSGVAIQRGDQFGAEYLGDAFVPESAGAAVAHFALAREGLEVRAEHRLYADPDYGEREFLAATDERFRPVDARVGPDGALYVIDMYRGIIQHADFVSDHLRDYVRRQGLEAPGATGRIWRVVRDDRPIDYVPPPLRKLDDLLAALDHQNGWVRDRAARRIAFERDPAALAALREFEARTTRGREAALRSLAEQRALDLERLREAAADPALRVLAIRLGETLLPDHAGALLEIAAAALGEEDPPLRLQAIHTLGALPVDLRPLETLLDVGRGGDAFERQAALSSLAGVELRALGLELGRREAVDSEWLRELSTVVYFAAGEDAGAAPAAPKLLDGIATSGPEVALALLQGVAAAQELPGKERLVLEAPHGVFERAWDAEHADLVARIRRGITWPGDPRPGGARALTPEEEEGRARGEALFATTCANCHGTHGRGRAGLAPPLAQSAWVRDADAWLVRIVLHGVHGPIEVSGEQWNLSMPGHGHDPRFDDASLAGLLTFLRRAWGHADRPVSAESVARVRRETGQRTTGWTTPELLDLPVDHRLDRFAGIYRIPVVGVELVTRRQGGELTLGRRSGGRSPMKEITDGVFTAEGLLIRFDTSGEGPVQKGRVTFGADTIPIDRVEE